MSELKYYKLRHIVSALASPDFTTGVVFDNHDEVYYKSEADKVIAHHKYKRCLAMAKWCFTKSNYHYVLSRHGEDAKKNNRKSVLYSKWHKRWLELAEMFK